MCYGSQRATAVTKQQRKASVIQFKPNSVAVSQQFAASWTHSIKAASPANPAHSALSRRSPASIYTHFSYQRFVLLSGVLCFSSQGREESGLGSKLTINNTLPEQRTRSNISSPSSLLPSPFFPLHSPILFSHILFILIHAPSVSSPFSLKF